jgi:hypothetical protein
LVERIKKEYPWLQKLFMELAPGMDTVLETFFLVEDDWEEMHPRILRWLEAGAKDVKVCSACQGRI